MNIPNHASGSAAAALDLLAAAGNALSPGHTPDAPGGPATGAGFLALVQQALGVQQPAPGCPTPDASPDGSPDLNPGMNPDVAPDVSPDVSSDVELVETEQNPKTNQNPTAAPPPTILDPIYAALVANFSPLPGSLPSPMTAPKNSAPVLTLVKAEGAPDGQQVAAAAKTIGEGKRAEHAPASDVEPVVALSQPQERSAVDDSSVSTSSTTGTPTTLSHDAGEPAGVDVELVEAAPQLQEQAAGTDSSVSTSSTSGGTSSTSGLTIAPISTVSTSSTSGVTSETTPVQANPVTTQVVDRITSLVSANGTHRITLDLNPDDLGQVRVVMTVRDGAVHVRLAAGERDTRAALVEGSDELKSLLGLAGATDTKITIRELGNAFGTQLQNQSQHQDPQAQQHAQGGHGWGDQDQHAGTRATYEPATDGTTTSHRDSGAGATGTRSSETVSSNRSSGLDVTM